MSNVFACVLLKLSPLLSVMETWSVNLSRMLVILTTFLSVDFLKKFLTRYHRQKSR